VAKDNDDRAEDRDAYKTIAGDLKSTLVIFLGFLLFVSFFIFFPYYFLAENYKNLRIINLLDENATNNIASVKLLLSNMYVDLNKNFANYKNNSLTIASANSPYEECNTLKNDSDKWINCNVESSWQKSLKINNNTIVTNLRNLDDRLKDMKDRNAVYNIIDDKILRNTTEDIGKWKQNIEKINGMTYLTFNKSFISFMPTKRFDTLTLDYNKNLNKKIAHFNSTIQSLEIPLVGKLPLTFNQVLLAFPIVIAIGFSFLSLQFKKLIIIHKELGWDENKDKPLLSWIDPLQKLPEKAYPLFIMAIPCILYFVFVWFVYSIWYESSAYLQNYNLLIDDFLSIPPQMKNLVMLMIIMGFGLFGYSYYEIFKAWHRKIPDDADAWNNKGVSLAQLGKYEEAIKYYDKAIEIKPDFANAWFNKGNSLVKLGKEEEARICYDKAKKLKSLK